MNSNQKTKKFNLYKCKKQKGFRPLLLLVDLFYIFTFFEHVKMRSYYEENHKPNIAGAFINTIWTTDILNLSGFVNKKLSVFAMWYCTIGLYNKSETLIRDRI